MLLCIIVIALLRSGEAAGAGNNNDGDMEDLSAALEELQMSSDEQNPAESAMDSAYLSMLGDHSHSAQEMSSRPATSEQGPACSTKYPRLRSMMENTLTDLLYYLKNEFIIDRQIIRREIDNIREREEMRHSQSNLYDLFRLHYISCKLLRDRYTIFKSVPIAEVVERFNSLLHESEVMLNERPASYGGAFGLHSPMDFDTDMELLAKLVVELVGGINIKEPFENYQVFIDVELLPALKYCDSGIQAEGLTDEMLKKIIEESENGVKNLLNEYQLVLQSNGQIFDLEHDFLRFMHAILLSNRYCEASNQVFSVLDTVTNVNSNFDIFRDLQMLSVLMRPVLSYVENNLEGAKKFLTSASLVSMQATEMGFTAPMHAFAAQWSGISTSNIEDTMRELSSQMAKISSQMEKIKTTK